MDQGVVLCKTLSFTTCRVRGASCLQMCGLTTLDRLQTSVSMVVAAAQCMPTREDVDKLAMQELEHHKE